MNSFSTIKKADENRMKVISTRDGKSRGRPFKGHWTNGPIPDPKDMKGKKKN